MKHYNNGELSIKNKIVKAITKLPRVIAQNGVLHSVRIAYIYFLLPAIVVFARFFVKQCVRLRRYCRKIFISFEFKKWKQRKKEILNTKDNGKAISLVDLGFSAEQIEKIKKEQESVGMAVLGVFDQDGYLLSNFGDVQNISTVSREGFLERNKFGVCLVYNGKRVGVKKEYRGNKVAFINELRALHLLSRAGSNVPSLINIDFEKQVIVMSYIFGSVLREELAEKGARLRDRDVIGNADFANLTKQEKWLKRIDEGKKHLAQVAKTDTINKIFKQFCLIYSNKFLLNDIKYGNIIIEKNSGKPYLIDFELAQYYPRMSNFLFRILRDWEIELFNLHFDTNKKIYKILKKEIKNISRNSIYSPAYFGAGLKYGDIWNIGAGYGRWNYILKNNIPDVRGKKILDLGSNNSCNSLEILRAGARKVVGLEYDQELIDQSAFLKESYEWADNREYELDLRHANMKDIVNMNLGQFDIVTAFCSIYYLEDKEIRETAKFISTITDTFVLQCNIAKNIGRSDLETQRKASVEYTKEFLEENGFKKIKVIAPRGYDRPLVIGKK